MKNKIPIMNRAISFMPLSAGGSDSMNWRNEIFCAQTRRRHHITIKLFWIVFKNSN